MFCNKCGKELKEGVQFCTGCGAQLKMVPAHKAEEAEAPAEVVAAQAESAKPEPQPAALQGTGKKKKTGLWLLLALILVAGVGCAVYFLFLREKPGKENPSDANLSQETSGPDILTTVAQDMRPKVWAQNEDAEIAQLIDRYFQAKTEANAAELERILIPGSAVDSVSLSQDAQVYEWYRDIRVYSYPGMKSMETGLFVTYYSKFKNIDTPLPTIAWFYVKQDEAGNLRLMPLTDDTSAEYEYIYSTYAGSPVERLAIEVAAANKAAIDSDPNLKMYLTQLAEHNYVAFEPETTMVSSTATPNLTSELPTQPPATTAQATQFSTTAEPTTVQHNEAIILPEAVPLASLHFDDIKVGTVVTYGTYEQDNNLQNGKEDIEWIVYWISTSNIYMISRYVLDAQPFAAENKPTIYENCYLDLWLENGKKPFMNLAFSNAESDNLAWLEQDPPENERYPGTKQTGLLYRRVSVFSLYEVVEYLPEEYWQARGTPYSLSRGLQEEGGYSPWWLRTMGQGGNFATFVTSGGNFDFAGALVTDDSLGVRPIISLKNDLFRGSSVTTGTEKQESETPIAQDPEEIVRQLYDATGTVLSVPESGENCKICWKCEQSTGCGIRLSSRAANSRPYAGRGRLFADRTGNYAENA